MVAAHLGAGLDGVPDQKASVVPHGPRDGENKGAKDTMRSKFDIDNRLEFNNLQTRILVLLVRL